MTPREFKAYHDRERIRVIRRRCRAMIQDAIKHRETVTAPAAALKLKSYRDWKMVQEYLERKRRQKARADVRKWVKQDAI